MILYWDNYITDIPLIPSFVQPNQEIRHSCSQYKMPKKIDIAKYTLASYAEIPWTNVIIKFDAEKREDIDTFSQYVRGIFPNAEIIQPRSTCQKMFKETVEKIYNLQDDWIFYAGNNDHPLIAPDLTHFYQILEIANKFKQNYEFISIPYSHFSEFTNAPIIGSPLYITSTNDSRIVEDNYVATSFVRFNGDNTAIQIVHKDLLQYWFCSHDLGAERIIRSEDIRRFFLTSNQLMIVPKKELCAHFDGYSYTSGITRITPDQVPPLFIPTGFFDSSIRIAYGYPEYREGWVNINPAARDFSFRDQKRGTDLKIGLQDIPLFWKGKIKEVDVNINADFERIETGRSKYFRTVRNPWKKSIWSVTLTFNSNVIKRKYYFIRNFICNTNFITKKKKIKRRGITVLRNIDLILKPLVKSLFHVPISKKVLGSKDFTRLAAIGLTLDPKKSLKLHFGCGPRVLEGWINIDLSYAHTLRKECLKYYPGDDSGELSDFYALNVINTGVPLPDESVDVIYHNDFIEHFSKKDQIIFLAETLRVLKNGGIHRINTPNLLQLTDDHSDFPKGRLCLYLNEWNKDILKGMALIIGYKKVFFNGRNQSKSNLIPQEYKLDHNDKLESRKIFVDLIK